MTASRSCSRPLANEDRPGSAVMDVADPSREVLAGEVGEHGGERTDVIGGGLEFRAAGQQDLELGLFVFGQGVRPPGEPAGHLADGRRRCERGLFGAALVEVVADGGAAAVITARLDLLEQLGGVAAALAGALVQVRLAEG